MQLIWTRSIDSWQEDRLAFEGLVSEVIHLPCVSHISITPEIISNIKIDSLSLLIGLKATVIITSLRCAKYLCANKNLLKIIYNKKIVCVSSSAYIYLKKINFIDSILLSSVYASSALAWLDHNLNKEDIIICNNIAYLKKVS